MPPIITTQLTGSQSRAIANALRGMAEDVSQDKLQRMLDGIRDQLTSVLNPQQQFRTSADPVEQRAAGRGVPGISDEVTVGLNPATARNAIMEILQAHGVAAIADEVDFTIKTATEIAHGAGNFVRSNDPDVVDAYPAWELLRVYDRDVPRGFKRGPKGTLVEVPDDAWPARWEAACNDAEDEDALRVFQSTGRMIALKDSDVWQSLGDGAGGYEDTLGNPFPPFAFNSGFDVNEISDRECLELGLLDTTDKPKPAKFDLAELLSL